MTGFNYLPAWELNRSPRIVVAFEMDFLRNLDVFAKAIPRGERLTVVLQLGWSAEEPEVAAELRSRLARARELFPEARFLVLANAPAEVKILDDFTEVYLAQHNAFLDPARYPVADARSRKKFDAIYIARLTPFKRHELATKIERLHLIGDYSSRESDYARRVLATLPRAVWSRKVPSFRIGRAICRAGCGLALSAAEGAMFSCGEYTLCGIPVVNTPNRGGRDTLLPECAVRPTAPDPDSVAEAVNFWRENPVDPREIRQEFLKLARPQKEFVQELLNSIAGKNVFLPHKLNIRCRLLPHQKWLHGIRLKES